MAVNRYQDLLAALPRGKTYDAKGEVLPFTDAPHEFELVTSAANARHLAYLNDVFVGEVTTDAQRIAIINTPRRLEVGEYRIKVVHPSTNASTLRFFTIKHIATWFAAYAAILESLDSEIDDIDLARSIYTVNAAYIENTYGRSVRFPWPDTFLLDDYRHGIESFRAVYRHFGAHRYGVERAVATLTGTSPLIVPDAWRPHWILGEQMAVNGDLQTRTRTATTEFAPPGASGPVAGLPNINRQLRYYIHPTILGAVITGFRQPPFAQYITATISDANRVTVIGIDDRGAPVTEQIPDPSVVAAAGTYQSVNRYSSITSASHAATNAQLGLGETWFAHTTEFSDYLTPGTAVALAYQGYVSSLPTFTWGSGPNTSTTLGASIVVVHDINRIATAIGTAETAATFNLDPVGGAVVENYHDRLYLEADGKGVLAIDVGTGAATVSAANAVTRINNAFNADTRYGASYNAVASAIAGTEGDNDTFLQLRSVGASLFPYGRLVVHPGPGDAARLVLGLPRSTTALGSAISGTTVSCQSSQLFPDVSSSDPAPFKRRFDIRVRGLKRSSVVGVLLALTFPNTGNMMHVSSGSYSFTTSDVGGYVRVTTAENPANNNGIHRIVSVDTGVAVVLHENPELFASTFDVGGDGTSAITFAVYNPTGEIMTVTNNNKGTNTLTVSTAPAFAWPQHALVEMVSDAPYAVEGSSGLGTVTLDVDTTYRPYHDFGDSISNVAGTTWRITSARGLFTGQVGRTILVSGCTNLENNGSFVLTAVTSTTCDFTNVSGIAETSNFEWAINSPAAATSDNITPVGSTMPDGWRVISAATTVTLGNSSSTATTNTSGYLVTSRIALTSANDIQFQRDVPEVLNHRGLPVNVDFWVQEHSVANQPYIITVSFNGSVFAIVATRTTTATSALNLATMRGPQSPLIVQGQFIVPYDATTCIVQLTRDGAATGTMSFEKCIVYSPYASGHYLGFNTITRNEKRAKFGKILYIWPPEPLTEDEEVLLGLPQVDSSSLPLKPGHVDYASNAHGYWERLDVAERDDSTTPVTRLNIVGVHDDLEWAASTFVNMEDVVGTPARLSYSRPTRISRIVGEALSLFDGGDGPGTSRANLLQTSNHEGTFPQNPNSSTGTGAKLFEIRQTTTSIVNANGLVTVIPAGALIPLPDTPGTDAIQPWVFMSATQIRINSPYYTAASSYVLDYDVLLRSTSPVIDLQTSGITPSDYLWLVDLAAYKRFNIFESQRTRVEQAVFDSRFRAELVERADVTQSATLTRDNGKMLETVNAGDWRFTDAKRIRINPDAFDADSIYSIEYTARVPNIESTVSLRIEWRASDTDTDLTNNVTAWTEVDVDDPVSPIHAAPGSTDPTLNTVRRYHQVRVTVTGVEDVRDLRVYGMGLKSVHLYGSGATAPGILTP